MREQQGREPAPIEAVRHRLEADGTLWLEWKDGHQTSLQPGRLRAGCPCAQCREERAAAPARPAAATPGAAPVDGAEPGAPPPGSTKLVSVARVGRYGLTPVWGDGHTAGIYSWDMLRGWCDCVVCRLEGGDT